MLAARETIPAAAMRRLSPRAKELDRIVPLEDRHTIDRWDDGTGENLLEEIASVGDFLIALQTYLAAVRRWPDAKITLRNRARVLEKSWE